MFILNQFQITQIPIFIRTCGISCQKYPEMRRTTPRIWLDVRSAVSRVHQIKEIQVARCSVEKNMCSCDYGLSSHQPSNGAISMSLISFPKRISNFSQYFVAVFIVYGDSHGPLYHSVHSVYLGVIGLARNIQIDFPKWIGFR